MSKYLVWANGLELGVFEADSEQEARDLCAQDAGYESERHMAARLGQTSELQAKIVEGPETPVFEALEAAYAHAGATYSVAQLDDAVQYVEGVLRASGGRPVDAQSGRAWHIHEILERIALRMFDGDQHKAQSFVSGYLLFRSGHGADVVPLAAYDIDLGAWEEGRANNPDYLLHKAAQAAATEAFRQRFGVPEPVTRKGQAYWIKHYQRAMREARYP